ncbi:sulfurtransferase TusA family protein [Trichloromonas sp.]|uniref:sulfurtransferase TusA family protein n=1 Tax=Trichloromonas sp. TaxID=3069249 RepID=UPI002A4B21C1|nr:sulfurtransferase TusA family protein [Trichloromonas sp.]
MSTTVDARGLSCPQPVLDTLKQLQRQQRGEVIVLVDTEASKENVIRAAASRKWQTQNIDHQDSGYQILLKKD